MRSVEIQDDDKYRRPLRMLCVTYNMAGNTFTETEDEGKYRKPSDHEKFTDGYEKYPGQA